MSLPRSHQRPQWAWACSPLGGNASASAPAARGGRLRVQSNWAIPRAASPRGAGAGASGGLGGPGAERLRWESQSKRFAPYLPSVRPILFSALKTDMSNWQLVPNRVQRSLVEHFYSCLLQLDAYSCRLNEKQNVL